jgi:uncharacterized protein
VAEKGRLTIDIRSLAEGEVKSVPLDDEAFRFLPTGDGIFPGRLRGQVNLHRRGSDVHTWGSMTCSSRLECVRCLAVFDQQLVIQFEALFEGGNQRTRPRSEGEHELARGELDVRYYTPPILDLGPLIRDEVLLAVPTTPTCREECRGLCPRCGTDLNDGPCTCEGQERGNRE